MNQQIDPTAFQVGDFVDYEKQIFLPRIITKIIGNYVQLKDPSLNHLLSQNIPIPIEKIKPFRTQTKLKENSMSNMLNYKKKIEIDDLSKHIQILQSIAKDPLIPSPKDIIQTLRGKIYFYAHYLLNNIIDTEPVLNKAKIFFKQLRELFLKYLLLIDYSQFSAKNIYQNSMSALCSCYPEMVEMAEMSTGIFLRVTEYKRNNQIIFQVSSLQKQMQEWVQCQLLPFFVDVKYSIFPISFKINLMTLVVNIVRKYKISTSEPLGVFFQTLYKEVMSSINDINISHSKQLHQFYQCQKFIFRAMYQAHIQKQNSNNDSSLTQKLQSMEEINDNNNHDKVNLQFESPKKRLTVEQFQKIRELQFRSRIASSFLVKGPKQKMLVEILFCLNQVAKQFKVKEDKAHFIQNWPISTQQFLTYIEKSNFIQQVLSIPKYQEYVVKIRNFIEMVYIYLPRSTLIACIHTLKINLIKQIIQSKILKEDVVQWLIKYIVQFKPQPHQMKSILQLLRFLEDWLKERNNFTNYPQYRVMILQQMFSLGHSCQNVELHLFDSILRMSDSLKKYMLVIYCKENILVNLQRLLNNFDEYLLSKYCENYEVTLEQYQNMLKPMFLLEKNIVCYQRRKSSIMGVLHFLYRMDDGKQKYFTYLKLFLTYFCHPNHKNLPNNVWNNFSIQPTNPNVIQPPFSISADEQLCNEMLERLPPLKYELDIIVFNELFIRKNVIHNNIVMHPRKYQIAQVNQIPLHFEILLEQFYFLQKEQIKYHQQYVFKYFYKAKEVPYNQMLKLFLEIIIKNQSKVREVNQIFKNLKTRFQFVWLTSPINNGTITKVDFNLCFKNLTLEDTINQHLNNYQKNNYRLTIAEEQKKASNLLQIKNSDTITIIKQKLAFKLNKQPQEIILLNRREEPLSSQYQTSIFAVCIYQFIDEVQYQKLRTPGKTMTIQIGYRLSPQKTIIHQCLAQHAEELFFQLPQSMSILWGIDFKIQKWGEFDRSNKIANSFETAVKGDEIPPLFLKHNLLLNSLFDYFLWKKQQQSLRLYDFRCLLLCGRKIDTSKDIFLNLKIVYLIYASRNFQTQNIQLLLNMLTFTKPDELHLTFLDFQDTYIKLNELIYKIIQQKPNRMLQFCMKTKMFEKMCETDITYNNFKQYWSQKYKTSTFQQKQSIFSNLEERMVQYSFNMRQLGTLLPHLRDCGIEEMNLYNKAIQRMVNSVLQFNYKNRFPPLVRLTQIYLINIVQFLKKGYRHPSVQSFQFMDFLISHFYDYAFNLPHIMFQLFKFAMHSYQNRQLGCKFFSQEINEKVWKSSDFLQYVRRFKQFQPKGLIGLFNNRNICFANSLFQQLYHNKTFLQELMAAEWQPASRPELDLILQLKRIFLYLKEGRQPHLVSQFYDFAFKGYDNHPIQMYYQMDVDQFRNLLFHNLQVLLPQNKFWTKIFDGKQTSIIRCLQCNNISKTQETFNSIHLSILNVSSLEKSLIQYGNTSILQNENAYSCQKCNKKVRAQKSIQIVELPPTLIFVLKRFQYSAQKRARKKLVNHFQFPIDQLKWFEQYQYKLKGIICHIGSPESGHYVSYIKLQKQWFQFNDNKVRQISIEQMITLNFGACKNNEKTDKTAYLLFYESENHPEMKNKMQMQIKEVGVQEESARIRYQTILMCKETFLTFHFLEFTKFLCQNHPQQKVFRLFLKNIIQISFKLKLIEDHDINQYVPHLYQAFKTIQRFQNSFPFIWQQEFLQRVMTMLKYPLQTEYKAILIHLLIQNCNEQTRQAQNVLNSCLTNIYMTKFDVFPYYYIMHGLAIKHSWASQYIFQRKAVGRILDLTFYGLVDNDTRYNLKQDTLLQFQSGYRVESTIICQGMRHHKWALLCFLVTKYYSLLHYSQKKYISPLTSVMVMRLIQMCKTKADLRYLNEYLCFLIVRQESEFSNKLISTIRDTLTKERQDNLRKYLRTISDIAKIKDQQQQVRCKNILNIFYKTILNYNTLNGESIEYVWLWMLKMANKNEVFRNQLAANHGLFQFLTQKTYVQSAFYRFEKIHSFPKTKFPLHRIFIPQNSTQANLFHNQKIQKTKCLLNNRVFQRHLNQEDSDGDMADQPRIQDHLYLFNQFLQTFQYFEVLCVIGDVIVSKTSVFKEKQPFSRLILKGDERLTRTNLLLQSESKTQKKRAKEEEFDESSMSSR